MACATSLNRDDFFEESKSFLLGLMGTKITVEIVDGRIFVGLLMCTDRNSNIVMRDVIEHAPPGSSVRDNLTRKLFLITVRGEHIRRILMGDIHASE